MTRRIVLSLFLAIFLLTPIAVGIGFARGDGTGPPPVDNGIGTSPSADDEPAAAQPYTPAPLLVCGIWVDATPDLADARSIAGESPDVIVFPSARTGCYDAVSIASQRWPEHSFVRAVVFAGWRAREAPTPHAMLHLGTSDERHSLFRRPPLQPVHAAFPILAILEILSPLITTIIGKIFTAKVKDVSRRSEIAGYADTAFHVVEALGKQYGWDGADKYNQFIQRVIDSVKASGGPELTGPEMAQLQQLATAKALMAKVHAALPLPRPLPLPPPPPRAG